MAIGIGTAPKRKAKGGKPATGVGMLGRGPVSVGELQADSGFAAIGAQYRETLRGQVEQLWSWHFDGTLQHPLTATQLELIEDVRSGGVDAIRTRAMEVLELVRNYEHVLRDLPLSGADIPSLNAAAAGKGIAKTVIARRADCGADVCLWSIRADDGRWMSECGISVPADMRKLGLPTKESSITPATAGKFATRAEAECEALERGIDWLQESRIHCDGEARVLIDEVLPLLEQSIKEISTRPDRPAHSQVEEMVAGGGTDTGGLTPDRSPGPDLILDLPLEKLQTLAANPEPDPSEVSRIAASLAERGQDEPIVVLPASRLPLAINLSSGKGWLVLAGATRLAAARQLGWTRIAAREREAMSYEEILAFAYRNNADRRSVGTSERAQYAAAIFATLPDALSKSDREAAVGARMGLDRSEINQLLRFGALPPKWQQRVRQYEIDREADDGIPWSCAKAFLPYMHLPAFAGAVEKRWKANPDGLRRKDNVRNVVQWIVRDCTRPLDGKTKHDYGWQNGGDQPRLYTLSDDLREKLQIERLPLGKNGKDVEVITNVELNDQLQKPFLKAIVERETSRRNGRPDKPAPSARKAPTPAEQRAKHAEQDQQLQRRICGEGGLREQALRLAMAKALKLGHWTTDGLYDDLLCTSRDSSNGSSLDVAGWRYEGQLQLLAEKPGAKTAKQLSKYVSREEYADYSIRSIDTTNDPADDLLRVRLYTCWAILWPEAAKGVQSSRLCPADQIPERFPVIVPAVLEHWSEWLCASVQDTWIDAATAGPARRWLQRFFESHNRRQLQALAASIGAAALIDGAKTGADEVAKLMAAHRGGDRLSMPSCLRPAKAKKGKAKPRCL